MDGVDLDLGVLGSPCVETWFSNRYGSERYTVDGKKKQCVNKEFLKHRLRIGAFGDNVLA